MPYRCPCFATARRLCADGGGDWHWRPGAGRVGAGSVFVNHGESRMAELTKSWGCLAAWQTSKTLTHFNQEHSCEEIHQQKSDDVHEQMRM